VSGSVDFGARLWKNRARFPQEEEPAMALTLRTSLSLILAAFAVLFFAFAPTTPAANDIFESRLRVCFLANRAALVKT